MCGILRLSAHAIHTGATRAEDEDILNHGGKPRTLEKSEGRSMKAKAEEDSTPLQPTRIFILLPFHFVLKLEFGHFQRCGGLWITDSRAVLVHFSTAESGEDMEKLPLTPGCCFGFFRCDNPKGFQPLAGR